MNLIMQSLMDRLRPLVGSKGWDYCVLWKLSEDQRFIEWMNCCCAGSENAQNGGDDQELLFPVSPVLPCRDTMFQHPKTNSCDHLAQLPTSLPLDSGIYAQTLISNQPSWLNSSSATCSQILEESMGTRLLIPLPGGLIELFVNKQIPEDQNVMDFIMAQCNIALEQEALVNISNMEASFSVNINSMNEIDKMDANNHLQPPISSTTGFENVNLSYDISVDRVRLCGSPLNLQQFSYDSENRSRNDAFFECPHDPMLSDKQMDSSVDALQASIMNDPTNMHMHFIETTEKKDSSKPEGVHSNSLSDCSDQLDDEDDGKHRRKTGKGNQSKNLFAERKRRKKLNERLYTLRSLVPNISKLDRASILGDAIEYVRDLQRQAKELQDELEEHSDNDGLINNGKRNHVAPDILGLDDVDFGPKSEHDKAPNGFRLETLGNGNVSKHKQDLDTANDKAPQMEPQVEVAQIDGNEFFVKVFCEHKPGRFVRLMKALNSLALEVTNANVTTFRNLVSNVLKVEKKDSKTAIQADQLRDYLLELTRNPSRGLAEMSMASENGSSVDYQHHHCHHRHHQPTY